MSPPSPHQADPYGGNNPDYLYACGQCTAITKDNVARQQCLDCIQNKTGTTAPWAMGQCVYNATLQMDIDLGLVAPTGVQAQCYLRGG